MDTVVASTGAIPSGKKLRVEKNGKDILVANLGGKYFAIGNVCTHMGCLLSDGLLQGENIICVCHGSSFDLKSGSVVHGPAQNPEPSYPLKVEGDQILVSV